MLQATLDPRCLARGKMQHTGGGWMSRAWGLSAVGLRVILLIFYLAISRAPEPGPTERAFKKETRRESEDLTFRLRVPSDFESMDAAFAAVEGKPLLVEGGKHRWKDILTVTQQNINLASVPHAKILGPWLLLENSWGAFENSKFEFRLSEFSSSCFQIHGGPIKFQCCRIAAVAGTGMCCAKNSIVEFKRGLIGGVDDSKKATTGILCNDRSQCRILMSKVQRCSLAAIRVVGQGSGHSDSITLIDNTLNAVISGEGSLRVMNSRLWSAQIASFLVEESQRNSTLQIENSKVQGSVWADDQRPDQLQITKSTFDTDRQGQDPRASSGSEPRATEGPSGSSVTQKQQYDEASTELEDGSKEGLELSGVDSSDDLADDRTSHTREPVSKEKLLKWASAKTESGTPTQKRNQRRRRKFAIEQLRADGTVVPNLQDDENGKSGQREEKQQRAIPKKKRSQDGTHATTVPDVRDGVMPELRIGTRMATVKSEAIYGNSRQEQEQIAQQTPKAAHPLVMRKAVSLAADPHDRYGRVRLGSDGNVHVFTQNGVSIQDGKHSLEGGLNLDATILWKGKSKKPRKRLMWRSGPLRGSNKGQCIDLTHNTVSPMYSKRLINR